MCAIGPRMGSPRNPPLETSASPGAALDQPIDGAAVVALRLSTGLDRKVNARMRVPQRRPGEGTVQRQVLGGDLVEVAGVGRLLRRHSGVPRIDLSGARL